MHSKQFFSFSSAISLVKLIAVVCAFISFALSMRQIEYERFSQIKPLFEITLSENAKLFGIKNHGGLVYFSGCEKSGAGQILKKSPRRYSTISDEVVKFEFSQEVKNKESLVLYCRDIDLNAYKITVTFKKDGFYIDGVPLTYRSDRFFTERQKRLDNFISFVFSKDWFSEGVAPDDDQLIVKAG